MLKFCIRICTSNSNLPAFSTAIEDNDAVTEPIPTCMVNNNEVKQFTVKGDVFLFRPLSSKCVFEQTNYLFLFPIPRHIQVQMLIKILDLHLLDIIVIENDDDGYSVVFHLKDQTCVTKLRELFRENRLTMNCCTFPGVEHTKYLVRIPATFYTELPTCRVCLSRLETQTSGLSHEHRQQILKRINTSCKVCRLLQLEVKPRCAECSRHDRHHTLWVCLICGFVGCEGEGSKNHAHMHSKNMEHFYSLNLETKDICDYYSNKDVSTDRLSTEEKFKILIAEKDTQKSCASVVSEDPETTTGEEDFHVAHAHSNINLTEVCYHSHQPTRCVVCNAENALLICLICRTIFCSRHSEDHYRDTKHSYSLKFETQGVWDFTQNLYVDDILKAERDPTAIDTAIDTILTKYTAEVEAEMSARKYNQFMDKYKHKIDEAIKNDPILKELQEKLDFNAKETERLNKEIERMYQCKQQMIDVDKCQENMK